MFTSVNRVGKICCLCLMFDKVLYKKRRRNIPCCIIISERRTPQEKVEI